MITSDQYYYSKSCNSFQANIVNALPTVDAGQDRTIYEGNELMLEPAAFSDPGFDCPGCVPPTEENFSATIEWDDGSGLKDVPGDSLHETPGSYDPSTISSTPTTGSVEGSFTYGDNGIYNVEVCVTDDDGGTGCDTLTVTVLNLAPTVTFVKSAAVTFDGGPAFLARRGVEQVFNSSAIDAGSDDLTFTWAFPPSGHGSLSTYFNDGTNPDPPHLLDPAYSPHGIFPFEKSDTNRTTFHVPGVYEVRIESDDDDGGADADSLPLLMTDSRECTAVRPTWSHQYNDPGQQTIDALRLQGYLDVIRFASAYFDDRNLLVLSDAAAIFSANGSGVELLKQHALSAWLNFASGGVLWDQAIPKIDRPFYEVIGEIDGVLINPDATKKDLVDAQQDALTINGINPAESSCHDPGTP